MGEGSTPRLDRSDARCPTPRLGPASRPREPASELARRTNEHARSSPRRAARPSSRALLCLSCSGRTNRRRSRRRPAARTAGLADARLPNERRSDDSPGTHSTPAEPARKRLHGRARGVRGHPAGARRTIPAMARRATAAAAEARIYVADPAARVADLGELKCCGRCRRWFLVELMGRKPLYCSTRCRVAAWRAGRRPTG
jgi:hypothetical protein